MSTFFRTNKWIAAAFLLSVVAALSLRQYRIEADPNHPAFRHWGMADFRDVIYYPTIAFLEGKNPYDSTQYMAEYPVEYPFPLYLPALLVINVPFALLPVGVSKAVYWLFNLSCYFVLARVSFAVANSKASWTTLMVVTACVLLSTPGRANFNAGQVTLPIVLGAIGTLHYARSRPFLSGLALAVAVLKPTFGVPLSILLLASGNLRPVLYAAALAGSVSLLAIALIEWPTGIESVLELISNNQSQLHAPENANPQTSTTRLDSYALIMRLTSLPPSTAIELTCFTAILFAAGIAIRREQAIESDCTQNADGLAIALLATLLCVFHHVYDALLLVAPIVCLLIRNHRSTDSLFGQPRTLAIVALMFVPAVNVFWAPMFLGALEYVSQGEIDETSLKQSAYWTLATTLNGMALFLAFLICLFKPAGLEWGILRFESSTSKK